MKQYAEFEEKDQTVNEPVSSYGLDINRLKVETMQSVMEIENPRMVREIRDYVLNLMQEEEEQRYGKAPCQFTVEELKEELRKSREDSKAGRYFTTEEVLARRNLW